MEKISKVNLRSFLTKTNGRFFTVEFIKKNGEHRKMTGRIRRVKEPKRVSVLNPTNTCLTVWSCDKEEYRNINLETVTYVAFDGHKYTVI